MEQHCLPHLCRAIAWRLSIHSAPWDCNRVYIRFMCARKIQEADGVLPARELLSSINPSTLLPRRNIFMILTPVLDMEPRLQSRRVIASNSQMQYLQIRLLRASI